MDGVWFFGSPFSYPLFNIHELARRFADSAYTTKGSGGLFLMFRFLPHGVTIMVPGEEVEPEDLREGVALFSLLLLYKDGVLGHPFRARANVYTF